ncbi:MAG: hypothetical protein OSA98_07930 [Rubripirellula sp.]|nr:hypothetical protein [Rubripirellula sp.]
MQGKINKQSLLTTAAFVIALVPALVFPALRAQDRLSVVEAIKPTDAVSRITEFSLSEVRERFPNTLAELNQKCVAQSLRYTIISSGRQRVGDF